MLGSLPADNGLVDSVAIKGGVGGEATDIGAERDGGGVSLGEPNRSRGLDVGLLATRDDDAIKLISLCFCAENAAITYERDIPPLYTTVSFPAGQDSAGVSGQ